MMEAYYNDIDAYCCDWLRNLAEAGEIPNGVIDERSIAEITGREVTGYTQCHFFAGIGGWPYALRLAGWPANEPVWTASCPCQPLSCAGKQRGEKDERHLWPALYRLISECRPPVVFGEQVASKDGIEWLDGISLDMEELGYAVGAADLPAAGVGAPHIRQRLFWVADRGCERSDAGGGYGSGLETTQRGQSGEHTESYSGAGGVGLAPGDGLQRLRQAGATAGATVRACAFCGYEFDHELLGKYGCPNCEGSGLADTERERTGPGVAGEQGQTGQRWDRFAVVGCLDGKSRRVPESSVCPLAHGLPRTVGPGSTGEQRMELVAAKRNRVGRLRGYGNAIVPELAAVFVRAVMDVMNSVEVTR